MKQPHALLLTGALLPAVIILASGIPSLAQTPQELAALTAHLPQPEDPVILPTAAETEEYLKNLRESKLRTLAHDPDGWDDLEVALWKARDKNYVFEPGNKTRDTDGDGLSDYQEMLVNRDATFAEPVLTAEQQTAQIREARRQAIRSLEELERTYRKALAAAQPFIRELIPAGQLVSEKSTRETSREREALLRLATREQLAEPLRQAALDALARKHGIPRVAADDNGRKTILAGEYMGEPLFIGSSNVVGAAGISADELWPVDTAAWPYSDANTGLSLTGNGQTLGMWEPDGGVRLTHSELGSRFTQKDSAAVDTIGGHPTSVAGTMAGAGITTAFGVKIAKGVACQANVFAYDLNGFLTERANAAAGSVTDPAVRVANHSWGFTSGWRREDIDSTSTVNVQWVWRGLSPATFNEDHKFGFYLPPLAPTPDGTSCVELDTFSASDAPRHLLMVACGNDRGEGPGSAVTYYRRVGSSYVSDTTARDWADGDDGGYDSCAPSGTAKNVLTVGAVEDVFRNVSGNVVFGYGSGANVVPASFTGFGPTDDGRIKPDLVAVGVSNAPLRQAMGQQITVGTNTFYGMFTPTGSGDAQFNVGWAGTSAAAPAVSGALGLVLQRRAQLFPLLPAAEAWRNATLKAIAIGTCDDVGSEGPDYKMGFGLMNAQKAVALVGQDYTTGRGSLIKELTLASSASVSWCVTSDGTKPMDITCVWSDPAGPALTSISGPDMSNAMLVNNLDVKVEKLSGSTVAQTFQPWVLNPDLINETAATRAAAATRGTDNRNNVEKVSIAAPAAGRYRITVTHAGGLSGNPAPTSQTASVTTSGVVPELPQITSIVRSATPGQYLLTYTGDVGAYFTIQTSTNLSTWANSGSVLTEAGTNSVVLNTGTSDPKRFWRLKRGQP